MSQHRFPALKTIAWILRIFAWVVAVVCVVAFILFAFTDQFQQTQFQGTAKILMGIGILLAGALYFLLLYAAAEGILVVIAIEENTRKAVEK
jgi:amino acid transporter